MAYKRRLSALRHSVMSSLIMPVLASSVLRRILGVSAVLILLLEQILPVVLTSFDMTCVWDDESVTFVQSVLLELPHWVAEWLAAAFIIFLLRNSGYYSLESRLHSCTACYAIVMFAFLPKGSFLLVARCSSDDTTRRVFEWINVTAFGGYCVGFVLQLRLTCLKMRVIATAAPKLAQIGSAFADATSAFGLLFFVCNAWVVHYPSTLSLWSYVVAAGSVVLCYTIFMGIYFSVLEISARSAMEESTQVDVDVISARKLVRAARGIRFALATTFAAFLSTIFYVGFASLWGTVPVMIFYAGNRCFFLLDAVFNFMCVAIHSDIACPEVMPADVWSCLEVSAMTVDAKRRRQIERRLKDDVGNSTGSALTIAVLMEGVPPEEILENGRERFRCICWDSLTRRPELILGGSPIDGFGPVESNLYSLSQPCRLGQCDVFYSHSWHESGQLKWEALKAWCSEFERSNGRKPRIWLDKVCLSQDSIDVELRSLPVFLAGCNTLFATSGSTYRSRLWCVMELHIYRMMLVADPGRSPPQVWMLGKDDEDCERQRQEWGRFDVRDSKCFDSQDKERFLRVVSTYPGGAEGFNIFIRSLAVGFGKFCFQNADTDSYDIDERI